MKYYEILYIVHPALEGGHLQDIIKSVDKIVEKNSGNLLASDNWGKKKLAYLIDKQSYGNYVLTQFSSDSENNANILKELEHNSNILAYLISRIKESEILKKKNNIEVETSSEEAPSEDSAKEEYKKEENK